MNRTTYPNVTQEEGVSLNKEIDLLRQAIYELKLEIKPSKGGYKKPFQYHLKWF